MLANHQRAVHPAAPHRAPVPPLAAPPDYPTAPARSTPPGAADPADQRRSSPTSSQLQRSSTTCAVSGWPMPRVISPITRSSSS
jgi:hypothetical protein